MAVVCLSDPRLTHTVDNVLLFVPQVTLARGGRSAEGVVKVTGVGGKGRSCVEAVSQAVPPVLVMFKNASKYGRSRK